VNPVGNLHDEEKLDDKPVKEENIDKFIMPSEFYNYLRVPNIILSGTITILLSLHVDLY
jgi:hypothetical protein